MNRKWFTVTKGQFFTCLAIYLVFCAYSHPWKMSGVLPVADLKDAETFTDGTKVDPVNAWLNRHGVSEETKTMTTIIGLVIVVLVLRHYHNLLLQTHLEKQYYDDFLEKMRRENQPPNDGG